MTDTPTDVVEEYARPSLSGLGGFDPLDVRAPNDGAGSTGSRQSPAAGGDHPEGPRRSPGTDSFGTSGGGPTAAASGAPAGSDGTVTSARWDEMVDPATGIRAPWTGVGSMLRLLGRDGLATQRRTVASMLAQDGVTYRPHGATRDRPWAVDPIPLLVDDLEWSRLEPALAQRAELLDLVLTDLYGERRLLADGLLPPEIVFGHAGFLRQVDGIRVPAARQLFMTAADLVRAPDGTWVTLTDRTQAPSGTGYAMANRQVVSRALPGLFRDTGIARLGPFFQAMRMALQALAPRATDVPRIVLLTSGPGSETSFDQAYLSSLLGFPLVEGSDLVVRDGTVWQQSIGRLEPVDVILRRVDAAWCDPLELRADSQLGVPGLIEASRLGSVAVVNGLGAGVLENPALYAYLPRLAKVLLDQPLLLPSVQTWWCGDETSRRHVLANIESLVIKPVSRRVRSASRFGWLLSASEREALARRIEADPTSWVGQAAIAASTAPGVGAHGLEARSLSLRSFAVADGATYRVLPGGLSRIAPDATSTVLTSDGTVSKDVWVLTGSPLAVGEPRRETRRGRVGAAISPRVAETLFWLGRYAERAEDVSRLVAVTDTLWRDVHPGADPSVRTAVDVLLHCVLDVTAPTPPVLATDGPVHRHLFTVLGDTLRTGTLVHDVRRVRDLAIASRDQLSSDTWAVFSDLDEILAPFDEGDPRSAADGGRDIASAMRRLRTALMAFAGLAQESMVRDAGWYFMDAGRRLERALQVARLLRSTLGTVRNRGVDAIVEESTLVAAESIITHRRRYPAQSGTSTLLDLLLLDRDNPRSLAFQLDRLATDLRRVAPPDSTDTDLSEQVSRISTRLSAADSAVIAVPDDDGARTDLVDLLDVSITDLHRLSTAVESAHFAHLGVLQQLVPLGDFDPADAR